MVNKIYKILVGLMAPKKPRAREMFYLKRAIDVIESKINEIVSLPQPVCCHLCAYPELHNLQDKLERQIERLEYLSKK